MPRDSAGVLVFRRRAEAAGGIDEGEAPRTRALRELREETGLDYS